MRTKKIFTIFQKIHLSKEFYLPFAILISAFLIFAVLVSPQIPSIRLPEISIDPYDAVIMQYNSASNIDDTSDGSKIMQSQPSYYRRIPNAIYIGVTCDLSSEACSKYYKEEHADFLNDFIRSGKARFVYLDSPVARGVDRSNVVYCITEQNPRLLNTALGYVTQNSEISETQFESFATAHALSADKLKKCRNEDSYKKRIENVSIFTLAQTQNSYPTFIVFSIKEENVQTINGSSRIQMVSQVIGVSERTKPYKENVKNELEILLK